MKYAKGKGIGYKKECSEFSTTKCRKTFFTTFKTQCSTGYKKVCSDSYGKKTKWWDTIRCVFSVLISGSPY